METNGDRLKAGFELLLWAVFLVSMAVTAPPVNWLAVRGAIFYLQRIEE